MHVLQSMVDVVKLPVLRPQMYSGDMFHTVTMGGDAIAICLSRRCPLGVTRGLAAAILIQRANEERMIQMMKFDMYLCNGLAVVYDP